MLVVVTLSGVAANCARVRPDLRGQSRLGYLHLSRPAVACRCSQFWVGPIGLIGYGR